MYYAHKELNKTQKLLHHKINALTKKYLADWFLVL